jgi:hypothetical protein
LICSSRAVTGDLPEGSRWRTTSNVFTFISHFLCNPALCRLQAQMLGERLRVMWPNTFPSMSASGCRKTGARGWCGSSVTSLECAGCRCSLPARHGSSHCHWHTKVQRKSPGPFVFLQSARGLAHSPQRFAYFSNHRVARSVLRWPSAAFPRGISKCADDLTAIIWSASAISL